MTISVLRTSQNAIFLRFPVLEGESKQDKQPKNYGPYEDLFLTYLIDLVFLSVINLFVVCINDWVM